MTKSHGRSTSTSDTYPKTISEKRSYKKYRQERRNTAELREEFERQQYREMIELQKYLKLKGEID